MGRLELLRRHADSVLLLSPVGFRYYLPAYLLATVRVRRDGGPRTTVRIQVLGPVRLWRGDTVVDLGLARRRAVLALLALAGGRSLSRQDLVSGLWPDGPPASAANIIQTHVKHLRRLIEPDRRPRMAG